MPLMKVNRSFSSPPVNHATYFPSPSFSAYRLPESIAAAIDIPVVRAGLTLLFNLPALRATYFLTCRYEWQRSFVGIPCYRMFLTSSHWFPFE